MGSGESFKILQQRRNVAFEGDLFGGYVHDG